MSGSTAPRRLRQAAVLVLVVGLALAAFFYWQSTSSVEDAAGYEIVGGQAIAVDETAAQQMQAERLGGHALVWTTRFDHWLGSLWHGERLAWTTGWASILASLLCLWIAGLLAEDLGD